jgi:phosphoribosylpyrophosphate synthetase
MAKDMQASAPSRFRHFPISWEKYPDGTDDITIQGFSPVNHVASSNILFFASFHNNDVTLSQFSVLVVLLQSFIKSITIVLPFFPVGTNERVTVEGKVATANTYSSLLSSLPTCGQPSRVLIYDIHALQERFYFHNSTLPSLHTSVPLLLERLHKRGSDVKTVAFPDDGAAKRFSAQFKLLGFETIICGKVRDGDERRVTIQEGSPLGRSVVIVDDLVQTGGTLHECAVALKAAGAVDVNAFVAHAVFPNRSWKRFCKGGDRAAFKHFWITNSIPSITENLPKDDCFEIFDLCPLIRKDLDDINK